MSVKSHRRSASPLIAGHNFVEIDYDIAPPSPPPIKYATRSLSRINTTELHKLISANIPLPVPPHDVPDRTSPNLRLLDLASLAYHSLAYKTSIDDSVKVITAATLHAFDQLVPVKYLSVISHKPWVMADLLRLRNQRDRIYQRAR